MYNLTGPKGIQVPTETTTAGGEHRQHAERRHRVEAIFWLLGLIVFVISCFVMHAHPKPYPFDLTSMQEIQRIHPIFSWINPILNFPSMLDNPIPAYIALGLWLIGMLLVALLSLLKKMMKAALSWLQAAIFLVAASASSAGINAYIDVLVGRPRPNPHVEPIHVYTPLVPYPTYPSGHVEHDVVYYGFLLYLSFLRPVREWRYRWLLLPFQLYAIFDMLAIGYSRILEGDHWLTDVLGGYLEGVLLLFLWIFLYRWTRDMLAKVYVRRLESGKVHV